METMSATQMANAYGLKSSIAFNKLMVKCGVLINAGNGYTLAEALRGRGFVAVIDTHFFLPSGIKATKKKAVWTKAGQEYIKKILFHHGIVPVDEQKDLFNN